jgi:hypothetical protein
MVDMNDAALIAAVRKTLWGPAWKTPMAEGVRHQKNAVADWASGHQPVPAGVWSELAALMRQRKHELDSLGPRVQRAHDAALQRTVEQAKVGRQRRPS